MTVMTVNTGSSSVRLAVFAGESLTRLASGHFSGDRNHPAKILRAFLKEHGIEEVAVVAHRVVHGGVRLTAPCRVDAAVADREFDALATTGKPVIFAHHGYPWLIHRLTYRRTNHRRCSAGCLRASGVRSQPSLIT